MAKLKWEGVFPAVTTPFKKDLSLDFNMFEKNLEAQIKGGVHGIIIGGSLGEQSTLTNDEKFQLAKFTKKKAKGRIFTILNLAEQSTAGAVAFAEMAEKIGCDGLMALPPMRYKSSDRETSAYFKSIAKSISIPVMIYNNPTDYKVNVTIKMFEELLKIKNVTAVKDSSRYTTNVVNYKNAFGSDLKVLCGVDTLAMECLALGADGWVAGLVDAFPKETVVLYDLIKAGKLKEARKLNAWFMPLFELDIDPLLVQNIKLATVATGIGTEIVRPPRLPLAGKRRKEVLAIIKTGMKTRPKL